MLWADQWHFYCSVSAQLSSLSPSYFGLQSQHNQFSHSWCTAQVVHPQFVAFAKQRFQKRQHNTCYFAFLLWYQCCLESDIFSSINSERAKTTWAGFTKHVRLNSRLWLLQWNVLFEWKPPFPCCQLYSGQECTIFKSAVQIGYHWIHIYIFFCFGGPRYVSLLSLLLKRINWDIGLSRFVNSTQKNTGVVKTILSYEWGSELCSCAWKVSRLHSQVFQSLVIQRNFPGFYTLFGIYICLADEYFS
jgi:hypothetical protein